MTKKKTSRKAPSTKQKATPPELLDRRGLEKPIADIHKLLQSREFSSIDEMNAFLKDVVNSGQLNAMPASQTALEQAQDLMYQAWEARGAQRVRLARKALEISPDCADAYVLLAEETAKTPQEARDLFLQGVQAGERAIGKDNFQEYVGHFWGILETRPYMRARAGLAEVLWFMGDKQQAVNHLTDLLRLNPGDNQGLRYILVNWLLETNNTAALKALLKQYPDDGMATWLYSRALLAFRQEGPNKNATKLLQKAVDHNPFVPQYLLGDKKLPKQLPAFIGFGDENEAIEYAVGALLIWHQDSAALAWLRDASSQHHPPTRTH
jgi:tetratricopeptide (TPR) repeat protein